MAIFNISTLPITENVLSKARSLVEAAKSSPVVAIGIGAGVVGVAAIGTAIAIRSSKRKTSRRSLIRRGRKTTRRLTARQRLVRRIKKRPGRQTPYTAGARKDRSRTRVRYTKTGQPYRLTGKGGAARFIKKSAAKRAHKR